MCKYRITLNEKESGISSGHNAIAAFEKWVAKVRKEAFADLGEYDEGKANDAKERGEEYEFNWTPSYFIKVDLMDADTCGKKWASFYSEQDGRYMVEKIEES